MKEMLWIAIIVAVIIFVPFGFVWSLNVLFNLNLDYTFDTWAAALIFTAAVSGQGVTIAKK